jgi:hypothetical protein
MRKGQLGNSALVAVVLAATAALVLPSPAVAQKVEFIPALGFYLPVGGWTEEQDGGTGLPLRRQLSALVFGARVSFPLAKKLDLQGNIAFTPSQVAQSTNTGTIDLDGGVYLADVRAAYRLVTFKDGPTYDQAHWDLETSFGFGVVHRGGRAWENTSGVTRPVVLFASELGVGLFRLTAEDFISWGRYNAGRPNATKPRVHHDFIFSLGISLKVGGR